VLAVDPERERISLASSNGQGSVLSLRRRASQGQHRQGRGRRRRCQRATINLGNGVEGILRVSEIARERVDDARSVLNIGDEVEANSSAWIARTVRLPYHQG